MKKKNHLFVNPNQVLFSEILEPYEDKLPLYGRDLSHGWRVSIAFNGGGEEIIDLESKGECEDLISKIGGLSQIL